MLRLRALIPFFAAADTVPANALETESGMVLETEAGEILTTEQEA